MNTCIIMHISIITPSCKPVICIYGRSSVTNCALTEEHCSNDWQWAFLMLLVFPSATLDVALFKVIGQCCCWRCQRRLSHGNFAMKNVQVIHSSFCIHSLAVHSQRSHEGTIFTPQCMLSEAFRCLKMDPLRSTISNKFLMTALTDCFIQNKTRCSKKQQ